MWPCGGLTLEDSSFLVWGSSPLPPSRQLPGDPPFNYASCPPSSFPLLPSSFLAGDSSLIRQPRKWARSLSGGALLACLCNESHCFAWHPALSSKKQCVMPLQGHGPPFWEHGGSVIWKQQQCLFSIRMPCLVDQMTHQMFTLALCLQLDF